MGVARRAGGQSPPQVWARQDDPGEGPFSEIPGTGDSSDPATTFTGARPPGLPISIQPLPSSTMPPPQTSSPISIPAQSGTGSLSISGLLPISTPTTTPGSSWSFNALPDATTCEPMTITWNIDYASGQFTASDFSKTMNIKVISVPGSSGHIPDTTLVNSEAIVQGNFTWPAVTVPAGSYVVQGQETDSHAIQVSLQFNVKTGSNTTCLHQGSSGVTQPSNTASSGSTGTPISGAATSSTSSSHTGAIAGGVVGGLAAVAFAGLAAWFFLRRKRRGGDPTRWRSGHQRGNWGDLGSAEYPNSTVLASVGGQTRAPRPSSSIEKMYPVVPERNSSVSVVEKPPHIDRTTSGSPDRASSHETTSIRAAPLVNESRHSLDTTTNSCTPSTTNELAKPFAQALKAERRVSRKLIPTEEELDKIYLARSQSEGGHSREGPASGMGSRPPSVTGSLRPAAVIRSSPLAQTRESYTERMVHELERKGSGQLGQVYVLEVDQPNQSTS